MEQVLPSKSEVALNWIAHGVLRVHFDARPFEVRVPRHLRKDDIVFEFGFDMAKSIPDLKIDSEAISGTLSFPGGLHFPCVVPWSAVYALSSPVLSELSIWINDAPASVQRAILNRAGDRANAKLKSDRQQAQTIKGHLRVVKGES